MGHKELYLVHNIIYLKTNASTKSCSQNMNAQEQEGETKTTNNRPRGLETREKESYQTTCPDQRGSPQASPQPCCTALVSWAHRRCQ